jgi:UDP-N-acetylglucosamine 2-epimerase (non-hydrolysing)
LTKKILIIVGTRPNFIKVTRFKELIRSYPQLQVEIVHTGQHWDRNMSEVFFEEFGLKPDYMLSASAHSVVDQFSSMMSKLSELILEIGKPDLMIVPGDVNSTLASALVANKMGIPLAHLESGLRSFDREMPEEINRLLTDEISDYFFVTEQSGLDHLAEEKKHGEVYFVGNTMIDTLVHFEPQILKSAIRQQLGIQDKPFILVTLHRPSNVDSPEGQVKIMRLFAELSKKYTIVFPIHPRTRKNFEAADKVAQWLENGNLHLLDPLGYFDFQSLVKHAELILTDSGGIQEESTYRQVPCLTLRENTERPITVDLGTNTLVPFDEALILSLIDEIHQGTYKKGEIPPLWDGKATERILAAISKILA